MLIGGGSHEEDRHDSRDKISNPEVRLIGPEIYEPSRHEALAGPAWIADEVEKEIVHIIDDFKLALRPSGDWPTHPLEDVHAEPK